MKSELLRKIIHLSSLFYPLFYLYNTKNTLLLLLALLLTVVLCWDILRLYFPNFYLSSLFNVCLRNKEKTNLVGATYFLFSCLFVVYFFAKDVAILSMLILIFCDTAASLFGKYFGKYKIYNKSLEGLLFYNIAGVIVIFVFFTLYYNNYSISQISLALCALVFSSIVELYSDKLKLDDNFLVVLVYALIYNFYTQ